MNLTSPSASVGNTNLNLHNSLYPNRPHSIIANYSNEHLRSLYCIFRLPSFFRLELSFKTQIYGQNLKGNYSTYFFVVLCNLY